MTERIFGGFFPLCLFVHIYSGKRNTLVRTKNNVVENVKWFKDIELSLFVLFMNHFYYLYLRISVMFEKTTVLCKGMLSEQASRKVQFHWMTLIIVNLSEQRTLLVQAEAAKSPLCLSRGSGEGSRPLNSTNTCSIFAIISSVNKRLGYI